MRWVGLEERSGARILGAVALVALVAMFVVGSAAAAGNKKLVEGTLYDTTCAGILCGGECPPPPHCGPITAGGTNSAIVCPLRERRIVACPLVGSTSSGASSQACVPDTPCGEDGTDPVYSSEGATINIRKRGAATVLATLPVVEGRFKIRLAPGEYVLHPYLPEPQCWSSIPPVLGLKVTARWKGPIKAPISLADTCVAHPDAR
jgi:hypothetical protein